MALSPRLGAPDWTRLLLASLMGATLAFLLLLLLLRTVLEPPLVQESVLRITRSVRLVEGVLSSASSPMLPPGVITRQWLSPEDASEQRIRGFDAEVMQSLAKTQRLNREIRRDIPPLQDPWGGYWIRLRHSGSEPLWLYQAERLSSMTVWYLPILRSAAIALGLLVGFAVFVRSQVEQPFRKVVSAIPDTAIPPLDLLPERGIAPLRLLTLRINRLLERINAGSAERRLLLRGLAHDLGAPQTRLLLQAEELVTILEGHPRELASGMLEDMQRLVQVTDQLSILADSYKPEATYEMVALDDFCGRIAASYPRSVALEIDVPRLLVRLDVTGLERSLCNLVDNAIEYGAPPLLLSAGRQGQRLWIRLDDHGKGLPTPTLLTMPTPANANDRQRSRHQGMGLLLVERYCRSQGGRLLLGHGPFGGLRAELQLEPTAANPLFLAR
jgi:two-component system osmolarity sensor histidine kinase EnvZ